MTNKSNHFVLKNVTINFPNLAVPKSINGSPAKYGACLLWKKDDADNLLRYRAALDAAYEAGETKLANGRSVPPLESLRCPLHDGDGEKAGQDIYEKCFFLNANCKERPQVVDRALNPLDPAEIYSGCTVNAGITLYAYNAGGVSKGIAAALTGIQLVRKGERIGWGPHARDEFTVLEEEDDGELPF